MIRDRLKKKTNYITVNGSLAYFRGINDASEIIAAGSHGQCRNSIRGVHDTAEKNYDTAEILKYFIRPKFFFKGKII
jgi:hypothetical protein